MDLRPDIAVLSICSGVGTLDLGVRIGARSLGLQSRTVAYCEREAFPVAVLVARIEDEALDDAPVWSDLTTFPGREWRGRVDMVVGGFPCQPVSVAGQRRAEDDDRWLWPAIERLLRDVRPRYTFFENVPGIRTKGLGAVLEGLAALGFDAEWTRLSAADVGASHKRDRWFLLAHAQRGKSESRHEPDLLRGRSRAAEQVGVGSSVVAHAQSDGLRCGSAQGGDRQPALSIEGLADTVVQRPQGVVSTGPAPGATQRGGGAALADANEFNDDRGGVAWDRRTESSNGRVFAPGRDPGAWTNVLRENWPTIPEVEPSNGGVVDGLDSWLDPSLYSHRADRLRAVGNGVVPIQAAAAFVILWRRAHEGS